MLKITRRAGESFTIAGKIAVTVLGVSGGRVLLGVEADARLPILRDNAKKRRPLGAQEKSPPVCAETGGLKGD